VGNFLGGVRRVAVRQLEHRTLGTHSIVTFFGVLCRLSPTQSFGERLTTNCSGGYSPFAPTGAVRYYDAIPPNFLHEKNVPIYPSALSDLGFDGSRFPPRCGWARKQALFLLPFSGRKYFLQNGNGYKYSKFDNGTSQSFSVSICENLWTIKNRQLHTLFFIVMDTFVFSR
jgi:hypothetical protein